MDYLALLWAVCRLTFWVAALAGACLAVARWRSRKARTAPAREFRCFLASLDPARRRVPVVPVVAVAGPKAGNPVQTADFSQYESPWPDES